MSARALDLPADSDRPTATVLVDGRALDPIWPVLSISVVHAVDRVPIARLVLADGSAADGAFAIAESDALAPGAELVIHAGYHGIEDPVFRGIVLRQRARVTVDGGATLEVTARHAAVGMTVARRCVHHGELSDAALVERLVRSHGLTPDVEPMPVEHADLLQYQCSDWDLMLARARAHGMWVIAGADGVRVARPRGGASALTLTYGATVLDLDLELDAEHQRGGVTVGAWCPAEQAASEAEAVDPELEGAGTPSALASVVGAEAVGVHHPGGLADDELAAWADGLLIRSRLMRLRGRVRAPGIAAAGPGDTVTLAGLGRRFDGPAILTGVHHLVRDGAWTTDFAFGLDSGLPGAPDDVNAPPAAGLIPAVPGLQVGVVTALAGDPVGDERVRVRLPMASPDAPGAWARLCTDAAGPDRGRVFRPEIDDEVVLGFLHGDPRHPVVLGAVHSAGRVSPIAAADENDEKGYVSRAGIRWTVSEDKPALRFETPAGRIVELDDDGGVIRLADGDGNAVTLGAEGVSIETGGDLKIEVGGAVTIAGAEVALSGEMSVACDGGGEASFTSKGTVTVRGSLVQIN